MTYPDPIITSILDDDIYKFSQQNAVLELFPEAIAEYRFCNRGKQRFNLDFLVALRYEVGVNFPQLALIQEDYNYLKEKCPYLKTTYLEFLRNYRYNPEQVHISLTKDNNLEIVIKGKWSETILWEVKLMAVISELYFKYCNINWNMEGQVEKANSKGSILNSNGCVWAEFGTRRRRNLLTQKIVVEEHKKFNKFVGTSNVYLSMINNITPKGTQAHEFFMGMQALEGIKNSNRYAMSNWVKVFNGDLGTVLTDTLGTEHFLNSFNVFFAKLFDGVRHDSGDPFWYTDLICNHYRKLKIDPMSKHIIFSNALDITKAVEIKAYCKDKINCSFGIGTHMSNDFDNSPALNMVIKLWSINDIPVVKLSDDMGKVMGDKDAIRVTKWECFGTPLDNKE